MLDNLEIIKDKETKLLTLSNLDNEICKAESSDYLKKLLCNNIDIIDDNIIHHAIDKAWSLGWLNSSETNAL